MISTEQTHNAHSSIFHSAIFDARTFEMIYENKIIKFLACRKGEKVYNI
jgi:hypothetical protein